MNELMNNIYDTLFHNTCYEQFNIDEASDQWIDERTNIITMNYGGKWYELSIREVTE